jgi:hypothetical protein
MRKVQFLFMMLALSFTALPVFSQEAKWIEMENFHAVMSVSFHPAEEDNLQPLKEKSADLLTKAKAWQKSAAPEGFNGEVTKPILKNLVKQCKLINEAVNSNNKTDAELKTMITKAHDIFHEIKEKCRK